MEQQDKGNSTALLPDDPSGAPSPANHRPDCAVVLPSEALVDKQSNIDYSPSNSNHSPLFINTTCNPIPTQEESKTKLAR
jgi:hypothetical protein